MTRFLRHGVGALSLVLATALPSLAWADGEPASDAAEIKKRGDEAMDAGRPADALAAYTEAYALGKDPALLYNKGRALQALTEFPSALVELEAFAAAASPELRARVPGLDKQIADLRRRVTTVVVTCDAEGAKVRVRDRTMGTCPLPGPVAVNAGKAHVEVSADGFFPFERDAELPGGGVATFDVHLVSKARTGILVIRSSVPSVDVSVDGKVVGSAPVETMLEAGPHALQLNRHGFRTARTSAIVHAGERREVDVPLAPEPSVFKSWWFWTGAALVVGAGVTTFVLLDSERDAKPGTVPPNVVSAGLSAPGFRF